MKKKAQLMVSQLQNHCQQQPDPELIG